MLSLLARRNDFDHSKLMKVFVKGESGFDGRAFYDNVTYAIGEAPFLVTESLKDRPCRFDVGRLNPDQLGKAAGKNTMPEMNRPLIITSRFEERQRFVDNVVGGD